MTRQFDIRKLPARADKMTLPGTPMKSKITFNKIPMEVFQVKVKGRNASVNEANQFIDKTMNDLFTRHTTKEKRYQVLFKLTDGRWYSSKFFNSDESDYYPDLRDPEYGIDVSGESVEHININVISM